MSGIVGDNFLNFLFSSGKEGDLPNILLFHMPFYREPEATALTDLSVKGIKH